MRAKGTPNTLRRAQPKETLTEIDPDVSALVLAERLTDAAVLARQRGDLATCVALHERALEPGLAARAAEELGESVRALVLFARAGELVEVRRLGESLTPEDHAAARGRLRASGLRVSEAALLVQAGEFVEAGNVQLAAGYPLLASATFLAGGHDGLAAHALRRQLADTPDDTRARALLAKMLARRGEVVEAAALLAPLGESVRAERAALLSGHVTHTARHGVLFGRFEPRGTEPVSVTATAFVLRALDRVTGREVAVKLFRGAVDGQEGRTAMARFFSEAQALHTLRSAHVVPFVGFYPEGPCVVTEFMVGGTLESEMGRGRLASARAVAVGLAVSQALALGHRSGILHRDVKPANVLFDEAGSVMLADFGVAHLSLAGETVTAGLFGTLQYMAPEVRRGAKASAASDVCSLGLLLIEALGVPSLDEDTTGLEPLLRAMTSVDPEERPAAAEVVEALLRVKVRDAVFASSTPAAVVTRGPRLVAGDDGTFLDTWLGRRVRLIAEDTPEGARAKRDAETGDLRVLCVKDGYVWMEADVTADLPEHQ